MNIQGLYRHLPTQGGERNRALAERMLVGRVMTQEHKEAALEQLSTIPEVWLSKLQEENMAFVGLSQSETLADTELLASYSPEKLKAEAAQVGPLRQEVEAELDQELATLRQENPEMADFAEYRRADELAERLGGRLLREQIGFEVRVQRGQLPLEYLQNELRIEDDPTAGFGIAEAGEPAVKETELFRSLLVELNGEGVLKDGQTVDPDNDVLLIPYKLRGERRISPVSEQSYASVTGQQMDHNHGMHVWDNRLVVLDDEVVALPSRKMGFHSVLLHEAGHAIDYIAEQVPGLAHRETVDRLYQRDLERHQAGEAVFLTSRAKDNAREYFAEAVEAYLTADLATEAGNFYKQENNHQQLQARNPELYGYLDKVMRWTETGR